MALIRRTDCFDPAFTNRLKDNDIPTQAFFVNLTDTITFKTEVSDTATQVQAGLSKKASDHKVNTRDNSDEGQYPGFTTFVSPAQLPILIAGTGITITPNIRVLNNDGLGDMGSGIIDLTFSLSATIPEDTDDIGLVQDYTISDISGNAPAYTVNTPISPNIPNTSTLTQLLNKMLLEQENMAVKLKNLARLYESERLYVGDVVSTTVLPASWTSDWLWCNGQEVSQSAYPQLFAIIGNAFGIASAPGLFKLPDYRNAFLRGYASAIGVPSAQGGADTAAITLGITHLPAHTHTITNLTTTANGRHKHNIKTRENTGTGGFPEAGDASGTANDSETEEVADHQHNVSGTTDSTGTGSAYSLNTVPKHYPIYFKIKVK